MLVSISQLAFFTDAIINSTGSLVTGMVIGIFIYLLIGRPNSGRAILYSLIGLIFSPIIGVNAKLVKTMDFEIAMNVFLFGLTLVIFLATLVASMRSDDSETWKEKTSVQT